jgi:hypothetical protein
LGISRKNFDDMLADLPSPPASGSLQYFTPMTWLLSPEDVQFFAEFPRIAAQFRRSRCNIFLAYLRDLHIEIAAFNRDSSKLIAHGAWDLLPHLCRKRALLLFHEARLHHAAWCYRWLPMDVSPMVTGSLAAIIQEVGLPGGVTA